MGAVESTEGEREPLLVPSQPATNTQPVFSRVYRRRWVVLTMFSLLGFMQGLVWNTWGPIQISAKHVFDFSSTDIAVLVMWGPVGYLPWLLFIWLMDKKGLRASLLLSAFFMVLGAALRSLLSTTWFAPDQRATATAVASLISYLGSACAFLIGPLAIPAPNGTVGSTIYWNQNHIGDRIQFVLYAEVGMIAALFVAVLLYFPSMPPIPPSVAAASQRLSYRSSICRLLSNMRFLMIALAYSVPTGVVAGWAGVLDMILTPAKVSQVDAGWIGFWSIVGGCVFGVAMVFIPFLMKLVFAILFNDAAKGIILEMYLRYSPLSLSAPLATLYTSCILVGIFINSSVPIFLELFIETVYPVPEGITCGVVTFLSNLFTGLMLFCLTFYFTELSWLNWCLTGSCIFSLLLLLFFRESYDRLYLDVFVSV
uniref:Solute carrier family 49 member 4 n=1 Tax=Sinocyclocheilus rhinocerous TaxID=307959 RepID=A0A673K4K6_9TELE